MKLNKFASIADALCQSASAIMPVGIKALPLALLAGVTTHAAVVVPGYLKYEYFPGETRTSVEDGTAVGPSTSGAVVGSDKSGYVGSFESGTNFADNYANRISGYFIPPTTGNYVFFLAADDDTDLFLSTDETAANKKLIAQETGWSPMRSWIAVGGGSTPEGKRSDLNPATEWPDLGTINLTAGKRYYIEAVHHEGTGGDNVAVTYKLASEADPANNDAPRMLGAVIAADADAAPATPSLNIGVQPVGGTFYTGQPLSMLVVANSDSPFPVLYQWRKNGTNLPAANASTFSRVSASAADAGSYDVIVSVPGPSSLINLTSAPVSVEVKDVLVEFVPGTLKYDYFPGQTRTTVENGTAGAPSSTGTTIGSDQSGFHTIFESGSGFADNYANRFSGFFIPATSGDYVFYLAADDDTDLFLSTDDTPANKKLIAQETGWSPVRSWNTPGSGSASTLEGKRSDMFFDTQWPNGNTITLEAGKRYYIEGVHHEGGGGDNFAATFRLATEDESVTADATAPRLTGPLIGAMIPRIMTVGVAQPTVQRFTFTITDSGQSVLDPTTVKLTFDGQAVTPVASPKANGTTSYTYTFPAQFEPNTTHYYTIQATDAQGQPVTTSAQFTLPAPWFPRTDLKGPAVVDKAWGTRFIHLMTDTNGTSIDVTGLANVISLINRVGTDTLVAEVIDQTNSVVNFAAGGLFGNPVAYPEGLNPDDFINVNIGHVVIAEESDYTFGVHSDDGFGLRIRGGQVVRVSGAGQIDPSDPEAVVHPADTGDSNTRAVYHLRPGIYRIEFFWWENGGGDNGEIYAAKGNFANDGDTQNWRLVGDPAPSQELTLLGVDTNGWTVISSDPDGDPLTDWATAQADLDATGGGARTYDVLNVGDPDTNGGVAAFPKDRPGTADDNYALKATATLVVPQDGTYVLGFNSDDGAYMKLTGKNFIEVIQNNTGLSVIDGDTVTCDCLTGDSGTTATVTLTAGNYPIEVGMFEQGGGSFVAARGALLPANPVGTGDIPFLAKGAAGTKFNTIAALQLTAQPATGGQGNPGGTPTVTITRNGSSVTIASSDGGTVQATESLSSPNWQNIGPAPQTVQLTGGARFFRVSK